MDFKLLKRENTADHVTCQYCGEQCSAIIKHLKESHPEKVTGTVEEAELVYRKVFPNSPLYTTKSYEILMARLGRVEDVEQQALHKEAEVETEAQIETTMPIPAIDKNYVQPKLETALLEMAIERNTPAYFFGMPGNGKTSLVEQFCARKGIPMIRVQHSGGLEDYEILGSERINSSGSYYAEGLLPLAMRNGYVYLADEYDFAQASVLAVYQSVLEGKPLVIRGANNGSNIIQPHPNFRFVALGNTNGAGDDTGLFQGTKLQNAANMERFGVVHHMTGMSEQEEKQIILKKTRADEQLADEVLQYVKLVRSAYEKGRITNTIGGVRVILNLVQNGIDMGDMSFGAELAFANRLPSRDAALVKQYAQRIWG